MGCSWLYLWNVCIARISTRSVHMHSHMRFHVLKSMIKMIISENWGDVVDTVRIDACCHRYSTTVNGEVGEIKISKYKTTTLISDNTIFWEIESKFKTHKSWTCRTVFDGETGSYCSWLTDEITRSTSCKHVLLRKGNTFSIVEVDSWNCVQRNELGTCTQNVYNARHLQPTIAWAARSGLFKRCLDRAAPKNSKSIWSEQNKRY